MSEELDATTDPLEQPFYADDFFVQEDDPGTPHILEVRGRQLTVWTYRTLDLPSLKAAQDAAVVTKKDLKNNRILVESVDEQKFIYAILLKLLKSWPFVDRATGAPTPITLDALAHLDGMILAQLTKIANEYVTGKQIEIDFFENRSDAPSSVMGLTAPPSPLAASLSESPPTSVSTGDPVTSGA